MESGKRKIVLIVHNVRSTHNVGSILRSADGFGVDYVYFSGYTPFPQTTNDPRIPHLAQKINNQIHKTALGAEESVCWEHTSHTKELFIKLKTKGFLIVALEQTKIAKPINAFQSHQPIALVVGNEVDGIDDQTLQLCDEHLEIPMSGKKESFNVAVAAAIALYCMKFN